MTLAFADDVGVGLWIPAEFLFNATPNLFFALATGFGIGNFEAAGDTIFVPLGLRAGWTVDVDNSPLVDIYGSFGWPLFVTSGGGDAINADLWVIGIGADFYLNFGS